MASLRLLRYLLFFVCGVAILCIIAVRFYDVLEGALRMKSSTDGSNSRPLKYNSTMVENMSTIQQGTSKTLVLVYTNFFRWGKWVSDRGSCGMESKFLVSARKCLSGVFQLTYDKQRFNESDLVVFHARNMPSVEHLTKLLATRPTSQRWVYALWESPNATPDPAPLNGLFNSTWTYRTDSEFWSPYGSYEELSKEEEMNKTLNKDYAQGKSELVAWLVGNCRAQPRMAFVHELNKYLKVDVFGRCSGLFGEKRECPNPPNVCLKQFKFYLSFENILCEDYITEKYWGRLGEDIDVVPVVMGGANYTKLAIPGSYINVMDFKTVKQLAEYLQYLDKNNTAYNEYFKWRLKYKVFRDNLDLSLCQICKWYVTKSPLNRKVYEDLADHWVKKGRCGEKNKLITNMWEICGKFGNGVSPVSPGNQYVYINSTEKKKKKKSNGATKHASSEVSLVSF